VASACLLRRCNSTAPRLQWQSTAKSENELSNLTLDSIEKELKLININLGEANDIAMLQAFTAMPANLDNESRHALAQLRDKMMERARKRAAL
jgi:hypothetical protein